MRSICRIRQIEKETNDKHFTTLHRAHRTPRFGRRARSGRCLFERAIRKSERQRRRDGGGGGNRLWGGVWSWRPRHWRLQCGHSFRIGGVFRGGGPGGGGGG